MFIRRRWFKLLLFTLLLTSIPALAQTRFTTVNRGGGSYSFDFQMRGPGDPNSPKTYDGQGRHLKFVVFPGSDPVTVHYREDQDSRSRVVDEWASRQVAPGQSFSITASGWWLTQPRGSSASGRVEEKP